MYQLERCKRVVDHDPHDFTVVVSLRCSGETFCGVLDHEPHDYDGYDRRRCPGRCHCGMHNQNPMHGPADHK